jgi:hypothetical protein
LYQSSWISSLSGIHTNVDRLAKRLRLSSEQDFAERVSRMSDCELAEAQQDLRARLIRLVEKAVGPVEKADMPEAVAEQFCRKIEGRDTYGFVIAHVREHIACLNGHGAGRLPEKG